MKPKIARVVSLKSFDGVLIGRDLGGILKNGHVYDVREVMGVIMLTDLGLHAIPDWSKVGSYEMSGRISQYVMDGKIYLTEEELEIEKNTKKINRNGRT